MFEDYTPSRANAVAYPRLVALEFTLTEALKDNAKFNIASADDGDLIIPDPDPPQHHPDRKALNFRGIHQPILVQITLQDADVRFPTNPYQAIGFAHGNRCPNSPEIPGDGTFHSFSVDGGGRRLSFVHQNSGTGGTTCFTLFLLARSGNRTGSIDPMMIND